MNIPQWAQSYFSNDDFKIVEEAIYKAELKTSGELVPVVVESSSTTGHVPLVLVLFLNLLAFSLSADVWLEDTFALTHTLSVVLLILGTLITGTILSRFYFFQRLATPRADQNQQVIQRAELEFYENQIHHTENATGILIFISLMERQVVVLGDSVIDHKLKNEQWSDIVQTILKGVKKKNLAKGLVDGLEQSGQLLAQHFPIQANDKNELRNHLVFK